MTALRSGGRLVYLGAGASGRPGCSTQPSVPRPSEAVQAVIGGGPEALTRALEGIEDDAGQGRRDLQARRLDARDVVVGITASGRTTYVLGALEQAWEIGATTVALVSDGDSPMAEQADIVVCPAVGPEMNTVSTCLKAEMAAKLGLNMLSTATMVRLGKVNRNLVVALHPANSKLATRARRTVELAAGVDPSAAAWALAAAGGSVKVAIVHLIGDVDLDEARRLLERSEGRVREAIKEAPGR